MKHWKRRKRRSILCLITGSMRLLVRLKSEDPLTLGLLSYRIAMGILESTKSLRLAAGFLRTASEAYQRAQMFGVCEMMRERWPLVCPYISTPVTLPSQILRHSHHLESMSSGPPPLRRASISTSNETTASIHSSGNQSGDVHKAQDNRSFNVDQLDTLA